MKAEQQPSASPEVAPADNASGSGFGRTVERLGTGRPPVGQQRFVDLVVEQPDSPDV